MHISVGASMLEANGLERKGNCSVSRIFKGGFTRGGRRRWEDVHGALKEAVETQERSAESRVLMRDAVKGTMISQIQKSQRIQDRWSGKDESFLAKTRELLIQV